MRIVGVGASAGGLESLEKLFANLPAEPGMAFVVVQHLSPDFKSLMTELLARHCDMPVKAAVDGVELQPNTVYLLPPGKEIITRGGRLVLTDKDPTQALTLPIDRFFRSLAHDAGPNAIAIVLSGSGSDGSRGVVEVSRAGGRVYAEQGADFDGMPGAAQATGVVDFVGRPEEIADVLVDLSENPSAAEPSIDEDPTDPLGLVFRILEEAYGIDFSRYRSSTVSRRLKRRMELQGWTSLADYAELLRSDPAEVAVLYNDLLIGVTEFFRDPEAFAILEREVIPRIVASAEAGKEIRVWVAGCATGEEAYSIAMLFHEAVEAEGRDHTIKVLATDLDRNSLELASAGIYPPRSLANVTPERRDRYFSTHEDGVHVSKTLRQLVVFAPHNVIADAPFTRMHLISCRNLLIYLRPPTQKAVLSLMHFGLAPSGVLFLGSSESPGQLEAEFAPIDEHWKIYRKRRDVRLLHQVRLPVRGRPGGSIQPAKADRQLLATYDSLLDRYMPPSFLVDAQGRLVDSFGGANRWLQLNARRPSVGLLDLVDGQLRSVLGAAIRRAMQGAGPVEYTGVELHDGGRVTTASIRAESIARAGVEHVLIELHPLGDPTPDDDASVESMEVSVAVDRDREALADELSYTRETLQATVEELETSNEQLQATNEELIASNEELQSTNEELHSVNEELYTVNAEHQKNISELQQLNNDMQHLIDSSEIATVFLDRELRIRRYTPRVADVFRIQPQDVGRRLHDFSHNTARQSLMSDIEEVRRRGVKIEREVRDLGGTPYFLRILPYRPPDTEVVSGVVVTLTDITKLTEAQSRLAIMSAIVEASDDAIIAIDLDGRIRSWNNGAQQLYGLTHDEALGRTIEVLCPPEEVETAREALAKLADGEVVGHIPALRAHRSGRLLLTSATISPMFDEVGDVSGGAVIARDVAALRRAQRDAHERQELVRLLLDSAGEGVFGVDTDGLCTFCNRAAARLLGYDDPRDLIGRAMHALVHARRADGTAYPPQECPIRGSFTQGASVHRDDEVFIKADGSQFDVEYRSHPLQLAGERLGCVVTFVDITARKRSEKQIRLAAQRREQFLAMLSHELRNPLAAVTNATALLDQEGASTEAREAARAAIVRQTRHMARLLDDLLDVSRITNGKFQLRRHKCDLLDSVRAAIESVQPRLSARGIELATSLPDEQLVLHGDPARLQQVVANLLSNAVRYSSRGQRIELTVDREDDDAVVTVTDLGQGIEPELLPGIFELFVQSAQNLDRSEGGLGVGLSLVRQIVNLHGGAVHAHSEGRNRGSEFVVRLPLSTEETDAGQPRQQRWRPHPPSPRKVVVVEDQADTREMMTLLLTARGHHVIEAEDGPTGIGAIQRVHPDVALVDIGLPTMTGYDVARRIRRDPALDDVTLIALTGYGAADDVEAAREAGFDHHLTKPADTDRIESILALRPTRSH